MTYATARTAVGAAATIALGAATLLGSAAAGAAPATITWDNGASHYTRTVSNTTPAVGEQITVSTKIERTGSGDEKINWFKDWHPSCLTYVTNSAKVTDKSGDHPVEPNLDIKTDYIAGDFTATSYQVIAKPGNVDSPTFSAQYMVGADCEQDVALDSGIEYLSSAGKATFTTKGPTITVTKAVATSTTTLAPVTGAVAGKAVTLTATIAPAQAGGSVTFKDGGTAIGTGQVGSTGTATVQWTPAAAGQHTITAEYSGSSSAAASQATANVTVASSGGAGGTGSADGILSSLGSLLGGLGAGK
ncbi:Ig-like domain repeat protein [Nocardia tengchongensis]|uniref:Ig-like domain repeat protein n=1 Tax=Nocardia tengchongensis TaxID=2055889 RepID=A0ABX8CVW0_9NOCA|nr:Ig-like domain-containing protein [Nocardia tengchongensis]QVI23303.1 Ig-like domain repeat protein [Nocardia tengchongensis]